MLRLKTNKFKVKIIIAVTLGFDNDLFTRLQYKYYGCLICFLSRDFKII